MKTITSYVEDWISINPFYAGLLSKDQINCSSLAREIKPIIESRVGNKISAESIIVALNRAKHKLPAIAETNYSKYIGDLSVQSNLAVLTIPQTGLNEKEFLLAIANLHQKQEYCLHTRGVWHTALIGTDTTISNLAQKFADSTIVEQNLAAITIRLKKGHLEVPGVCAYVLQLLAMRNINLQEVTSSYDELTLIIKAVDLSRTLDLLINTSAN